MNLEQFAEKAGVIIIRCDKEWGGTWGYTTKDNPDSSVNGYRTKKEVLNGWLIHTFGDRCAKAVKSLLEKG